MPPRPRRPCRARRPPRSPQPPLPPLPPPAFPGPRPQPGPTPPGAQAGFLKLLVAKLNNQDPMNPLDNAQMTSQIAQINTVTGIQQLNQTMQRMAAQFDALQL